MEQIRTSKPPSLPRLTTSLLFAFLLFWVALLSLSPAKSPPFGRGFKQAWSHFEADPEVSEEQAADVQRAALAAVSGMWALGDGVWGRGGASGSMLPRVKPGLPPRWNTSRSKSTRGLLILGDFEHWHWLLVWARKRGCVCVVLLLLFVGLRVATVFHCIRGSSALD